MGSVEMPLGRLEPADWVHVERYPLHAMSAPVRPTGVPVVIGIPWYSAFDRPERDSRGRYWIGRGTDLGSIRGGHAVVLEPSGGKDSAGWYEWYDQGTEGACVGFACSRMMSLLNRRRYDARWLYHEAQRVDEWPGEDYSGTSVRAALDIMRTVGHREVRRGKSRDASAADGIAENRWATNVDDVLATLNTAGRDHVVVLNSWGTAYPHRVRMPAATLDRVLREGGEAGVVTDRVS